MHTGAGTLPKLALLDWDGTLVDSYGFLKAAHNHVREAMGHEPWDDSAFKEILKHSTREIYGQLYGVRESEAKEVLHRYIDTHHADSLVPMEGALELLESFHSLDIPAGIVSNKRHERLAGDIAALGWSSFIAVTVGAGRAPRDKPAADPIRLAIEEIGYSGDASDVWYIGDTETDLLSARAAGVTSVFMLHGMGGADLAERYGPLYVFDNLNALIGAIRKKKSESSEKRSLQDAQRDFK